MRPMPVRPDDPSEARRQVEAHCQSLVDAGLARWQLDHGRVELRLRSGETYRLGELGLTRLR